MKRMNKKPDVLLILAVIFGLGVLVSTLTHGDGENQAEQMAASAPASVQATQINR